MNNAARPLAPDGSPNPSNIILAVASIALGLCGFCALIPTIMFTPCGIVSIALGLAAVITGLLSFVRSKRSNAAAGLRAAGIIGAVIGVFSILAPVAYLIFVMILWFGVMAASQPTR